MTAWALVRRNTVYLNRHLKVPKLAVRIDGPVHMVLVSIHDLSPTLTRK